MRASILPLLGLVSELILAAVDIDLSSEVSSWMGDGTKPSAFL
jgi:hypothetical protein